jgi:hypothetical protein
MARQQPGGPKLVRISQVFGFPAGQRCQPRTGVNRNLWRLAWPRAVFEGRRHTEPYRSTQAAQDGLMGHAKRLADRVGRGIGAIGQKDAGSLDPTRRFRPRPRNPFQLRQVVLGNRDIDDPTRCCHDAQRSCFDPQLAYTIQRRAGNPLQRVGFTESMY